MKRSILQAAFLILLVLALLPAIPAMAGLSRHEELVVINDQSPISVAIADYYVSARNIPSVNVCHLTTCPTSEWVSPQDWYDYIRTPIWNYLNDSSHPWLKDQVKTILLTKGVPLKCSSDFERQASVDMPLCYLGNTCYSGDEPAGGYAFNSPLTALRKWCDGRYQLKYIHIP